MPLVVSNGRLMKEKSELGGGALKMEEKIGKIGESSS